jgi:hypothetical protein
VPAVEATFHQAKVLMQAGISSSIADEVDSAVKFFTGAKVRFEKLNKRSDAEMAQAWLDGLKLRQDKQNLEFSNV